MSTIIFRKNFEVKKYLFEEELINKFPFANEFYTAIFLKEGNFNDKFIEAILTKSKVKEEYFNDAIGEYFKRLKPYARVKFIDLNAESFNESNKEVIREIESQRIIKSLEKYNQNEVFLLHERGKIFNSLEFASFINQNQKVVFVIGGSLGFSEELLSKYQQISLSNLTFLHEMVRVILLEQIYRAITILKVKNYHH